MRYKVIISYDGSKFSGYQVQDNARTVQGELEKVLEKITKEKIRISAAGRTDTGVHAKAQVFHFDTELNISRDKMLNAINSKLPKDIYARRVTRVSSEFHSRFDAVSKHYQYMINVGEYNPILKDYIYQYNRSIDIELLKDGAKYLIGKHDFTSLTTGDSRDNDNVREITSIEIEEINGVVVINVYGDGFLKYMVRNIIGLLLAVSEGKIEAKQVAEVVDKKKREQDILFKCVPGCGLYLMNVRY